MPTIALIPWGMDEVSSRDKQMSYQFRRLAHKLDVLLCDSPKSQTRPDKTDKKDG
ncbi:hypothetical protein [Coleofasciculus sp. E1-EBD-02]|uniref:hypothetical protein n=1 Tax=Coleofasciculus sp. E1-EBD-02 TaxID=3068481 RepID=UPI0032F3C65B